LRFLFLPIFFILPLAAAAALPPEQLCRSAFMVTIAPRLP
jgi:hypothetical protein